ncbi:hypothetical protein B5T_01211 [Alloalcanivorax dieselolei B5]|uniref:DUF3291 domain-containing protein n=1 Tax=Alcanivorax dieselolei (strain DSM 16502 / CGMCC 1.3690 / MCCC 1A00001 / B-5) TaxID=930169 RepID=K0C7N6_ALCDB|nr:DUF3291 domain-containing protein [Alloalcanivorax dieselolei]AFT69494.1 hypothetical protein B5T_01211 [Alloalcanivorax dieselolei B5]GGK10478.1 hypothetical protein GCM10007426_43380 [Alloalcanivorax dieselolei]
MSQYHIAQLNIATLLAPIDSPQLSDFIANLDRINALAEGSPGFIWRLQTEQGDATGIDYFGSDKIVNLSLWNSVEELHNYVYRSAHVEIMRRKKEWFHKMGEAYMVLWWVPVGHTPSIEEAAKKLNILRETGPTAEAFTFKKAFSAPDELAKVSADTWGGECPTT